MHDDIFDLNHAEDKSIKQVFAVSLGFEASVALQKNECNSGKVHSVFKKAFNILFPDGSLLSLVVTDVGGGPFNIVVSLPEGISFDALETRLGQKVHANRNFIRVGELCIDMRESPIYKAKHYFASTLLTLPVQIQNNISRMATVVRKEGHFEGLAQLLDFSIEKALGPEPDLEEEQFGSMKSVFFPEETLSVICSLLRAAENNDLERIKSCATSLVGLGPGLTPAADDFLSGLMLALFLFADNLHGNLERVKKINRAILMPSNQTTVLSSQYLRQAAVGNGNESAVSLIAKLLTSCDARDVESATRKLINVGATSGTDSAIGIILGSKLAMKLALPPIEGSTSKS